MTASAGTLRRTGVPRSQLIDDESLWSGQGPEAASLSSARHVKGCLQADRVDPDHEEVVRSTADD